MNLPFLKFFPSDWLFNAETQGLPAAGRGAVINLWCWLWHRKRLSTDDAQLAMYAGCTPAEWAAVRGSVLCLFQIDGAELWHQGIDKLRQEADAFHEERSAAGKRGAASTWKKSKAISSANGSANGKSEVRSQKLEVRSENVEKQTPPTADAVHTHTPSTNESKSSKRKTKLTPCLRTSVSLSGCKTGRQSMGTPISHFIWSISSTGRKRAR